MHLVGYILEYILCRDFAMTQICIFCVLQRHVEKLTLLIFVKQALQLLVFVVFMSLKVISFGSESTRLSHG